MPEQYRVVEDGLCTGRGVKGNVARLLTLQHCIYGGDQPVGIFVLAVYVTPDHAAALESGRAQREQRYGRTGDDLDAPTPKNEYTSQSRLLHLLKSLPYWN